MSKQVQLGIAMILGMIFLSFTMEYIPQTQGGTIISAVLLMMVAYPIYRILNKGTDKTFVVGAAVFVVVAVLATGLQEILPSAFVRYSAAAMVALSIVAITAQVKRIH